MWYVWSKLIIEGGIKWDGNSGIPGKSIPEIKKANENCCNTLLPGFMSPTRFHVPHQVSCPPLSFLNQAPTRFHVSYLFQVPGAIFQLFLFFRVIMLLMPNLKTVIFKWTQTQQSTHLAKQLRNLMPFRKYNKNLIEITFWNDDWAPQVESFKFFYGHLM